MPAPDSLRTHQPKDNNTMSTALPPSGLLCELLSKPEDTFITNPKPRFSWIVNDTAQLATQGGYQILVASSLKKLWQDEADLWDSGAFDPANAWSQNPQSLHIEYGGKELQANSTYAWKVRTWNHKGEVSLYSEPQVFRTGELSESHQTPAMPLTVTDVAPLEFIPTGADSVFIDFGNDAFGTLAFNLNSPATGTVIVALGEVLEAPHKINRAPGGSRRYREISVEVKPGEHSYQVEITPDERNTGEMAIKVPAENFEVIPFRYAELRGLPAPLTRRQVRQRVLHYPFDDTATRFNSAAPALNRIWQMCHHTMKATTVCGLYIDGDRERIPYEADAYINMLGHYACDREFTMARRTHEYLLTEPTWPTEWILFSVLMAWEDYMHTGDPAALASHYETLQHKTLSALAREDGLISTAEGVTPELLKDINLSNGELRDIVDWPQGERDNYDMQPVNTVVNAFHVHTLNLMEKIAQVLGKSEDAEKYQAQAARAQEAFQATFFDTTRQVYVDGEGSTHASLHANMFPLCFGLVPKEMQDAVVSFVASRGMACSVYGAQFLLDGLYRAEAGDTAYSLLSSPGRRSWLNMLRNGATMAMEAWDDADKPNQDWNHAWGAAPASIIPRGVMGIMPLEPGFAKIQIKPQPGSLPSAEMTLPTIRGDVRVSFQHAPNEWFRCVVAIPANTTAEVSLPICREGDNRIDWNGEMTNAIREGNRLVIRGVGSGTHSFRRG
jgi:hypothetical protein